MNDYDIEFIVKYMASGESGRLTLIGYCAEAPIPVGHTFDLVYRNQRQNYPEEAGDEPVRVAEYPASLRVVCIHAYEQSVGELGRGMAGSLVVEGEGAQHVAPGWILGRRDFSRQLIAAPFRPAGQASALTE